MNRPSLVCCMVSDLNPPWPDALLGHPRSLPCCAFPVPLVSLSIPDATFVLAYICFRLTLHTYNDHYTTKLLLPLSHHIPCYRVTSVSLQHHKQPVTASYHKAILFR